MYPTKDFPGYGSFVKNACEGLKAYGLSITAKAVISGKPKSKLQKVIKYFNFYLNILYGFISRKFDFIYIHFPNQAIPLLRIIYKLKCPPIIINYHGEDLQYDESSYWGRFLGIKTEEFCRRYAIAIVVPSDYFKHLVIKRHLIPEDKIIVSPSGGINPKIFFPSSNLFMLSNNESIHIGSVGRLEEGKGIREFLDTCKLLNEKKIKYKGTIIGYGSLYNEVKSFISENNLISHISLINGVSQKELGMYYRKFNLLIFSSSRTGESLGLTGIEAMACGTPVVGSNIGGISTYLKNGYNGYSVPVNDVYAIYNSIIEYQKLSFKEKASMRSACLETAKSYYNDFVCSKLSIDIIKTLDQYLF